MAKLNSIQHRAGTRVGCNIINTDLKRPVKKHQSFTMIHFINKDTEGIGRIFNF